MPSPTLLLHQPPSRPWGTPNLSPFCIKLETYLRMAEIPFELRAATAIVCGPAGSGASRSVAA